MKTVRTIALISDTHIGSNFSLFPPQWTPQNGPTLYASKEQKKIWDFWIHFCKECNKNGVDTVLHLGDAIEGRQEKTIGDGISLPDLTSQVECAVDILSYIAKGRRFGLISGTTYHDSRDISTARMIVKGLSERGFRAEYLGYVATLKVKGTKYFLNIAHSFSSTAYRGTGADQQMVWSLVAESLRKLPPLHIQARGHVHSNYYAEMDERRFYIVPAWKTWDPYVPAIRNYPRMQPSIGGWILRFGSRGEIEHTKILMKDIPRILDKIFEA